VIATSLPGIARDEKTTISPRSEIDVLVLAVDNPGQRRPRLALAAGQERYDALARR